MVSLAACSPVTATTVAATPRRTTSHRGTPQAVVAAVMQPRSRTGRGTASPRVGDHGVRCHGRPLVTQPWWSRSAGRGAEHLADRAPSGGDDVGPGQGQLFELLLRELLAQRGAVPVDEVEVPVSAPAVDPPGDRERDRVRAGHCGEPL